MITSSCFLKCSASSCSVQASTSLWGLGPHLYVPRRCTLGGQCLDLSCRQSFLPPPGSCVTHMMQKEGACLSSVTAAATVIMLSWHSQSRGGLDSFQNVMQSPVVRVPHFPMPARVCPLACVLKCTHPHAALT